MHTRYIYGPNIPIKDANAHNLHMHTRYISFFELSSSVLFRRSQPTYAYKIYLWFQSEPLIRIDLTTYICIQDISSVVQPENQCKVSQPTYAYKIYHLHGRRAIYPRDSQPTYAYKIYLRRCQSGCNFPSLTTYICIQDISAFVANFKWCFELTTYICIQDISIPFSHNCNGMYHSQPTYAYKIYHQINTNISCLQGLNL